MNSMSSQPCRPISTQSITSTDSADSEENYVAMVSPVAAGETAHGILSFNNLRHVSTPCVSEANLSPLAEPSVYLPSREWHQQPGP